MAKIEIKSTLNSDQYRKGIDQMKTKNAELGRSAGPLQNQLGSTFGSFANILKGGAIVGGIMAIAGALKGAIGTVIEFGGRIADLSAQAGLSVESFQKISRAVRDAGGADENVVTAFVKLKDAQGAVVDGNEKTIAAFERLGISVDEVLSLSPEALFIRMSEAMTQSGNSAGTFNATADILGAKTLPKLLDAMNAIGSGADLGEGMTLLSSRSAATLDAIGDKWENLKNRIKAGSANTLTRIYEGLFGSSAGDQREEALARQQEAQQQAQIEEAEKAKADIRAKAQEKAQKELDKKAKEQAKKDKAERAVEKRMKDIEDSAKTEIDTDRFKKMGLLAGNSNSWGLSVERRKLQIAEKQEELLKEIADNTEDAGGLAE